MFQRRKAALVLLLLLDCCLSAISFPLSLSLLNLSSFVYTIFNIPNVGQKTLKGKKYKSFHYFLHIEQ